jgi:hypothetical protein
LFIHKIIIEKLSIHSFLREPSNISGVWLDLFFKVCVSFLQPSVFYLFAFILIHSKLKMHFIRTKWNLSLFELYILMKWKAKNMLDIDISINTAEWQEMSAFSKKSQKLVKYLNVYIYTLVQVWRVQTVYIFVFLDIVVNSFLFANSSRSVKIRISDKTYMLVVLFCVFSFLITYQSYHTTPGK